MIKGEGDQGDGESVAQCDDGDIPSATRGWTELGCVSASLKALMRIMKLRTGGFSDERFAALDGPAARPHISSIRTSEALPDSGRAWFRPSLVQAETDKADSCNAAL